MSCFYPALVLFEQSNCIVWIIIFNIRSLIYFFLVSDSCWAKVRNGNNISPDFTTDAINNLLKRCFFLLFLGSLDFLTLQDKCNICTLSENIKHICTRHKLTFLHISKSRTNKILYFLTMYIYCLFMTLHQSCVNFSHFDPLLWNH